MARVLVVEDEHLVALDIVRCLESHGHTVVDAVSSGEAAIGSVERHNPDLALLDIQLDGGVDGIEVASQLSYIHDVPSILLTAHGDKVTVERAQKANPSAYLIKPFKDADLIAAITTALHQHQRSANWGKLTDAVAPEEDGADGQKLSNHGDPERAIETVLGKLSLFSSLTPDQLSGLAKASKIVSYPAGTAIFRLGGTPIDPFIPVSGRVALFTPRNKGPDLIMAMIAPFDLFGLFSAFENGCAVGDIRVLRACEMVQIPRQVFLATLDHHPGVGRRVAEEISHRLVEAHAFLRSLTEDRAETRVAQALSALLPRISRVSANGRGLSVDVSRTELAALSGLTLETTVRVLARMESAGLVGLAQRRCIEVINPEGLAGMIGERAVPA